MSPTPASLVHLVRPAGGQARGTLVLFHGRGADEYDLVPLLEALDPDASLIGITVRGPLALQPGGAHWYAVREIGYPDPATFGETYSRVGAWLDSLPGLTGIGLERTVVGGFSQGAVIAYAVALGAGRPRPAGVIALSGFIPTVDAFPLDLDDLTDFPVAIGHGRADPVIGVEWGRQARAQLEAAGATVMYDEGPIGHSIDPRFISRISGWLSDALPSASS